MRIEQRLEDLVVIEVGSSQESGLGELRQEEEPVGCRSLCTSGLIPQERKGSAVESSAEILKKVRSSITETPPVHTQYRTQ